MKKKLFFLWALLLASIQIMAGNGHATHYGKVTVNFNSTGNGSVYIGTSSNATSGNTTETWNCDGNSGNDSKTYYLFATPDNGYAFDGWYTNEVCTEGKTTEQIRTVTIKATSEAENNPTQNNYYAKFIPTYTYYTKASARAVGNGKVSVSENSTPGEYGSEKELSKEETATSAPTHKYYLHAQATPGNTFVGWYTDEACTNEKSQDNPLIVDIEGTTSAPEANVLYAKFNNGEDYTSRIVNPGAEAGNASGWVGEIGILNNGHQHSGTYLFETAGWGKNNGSMSQTISDLPNGYYKISAWYIAATETSIQVHGNDVSSVVGQGVGDSQWNQLTTDLVTVKNGTLTIKGTSATTAGQNWANFDDFTLTYYGPLSPEEAYELLAAALEECKPWDGASYTVYTTTKAAYDNKTYTTEEQITNAISELRAAFETFRRDNASMEHPYLVEGVIKHAELNTNDDWDGNGRTTTSGEHWSGDASRVYFSFSNGTSRHQAVTLPYAGVYELRTAVRTLGSGAFAQVVINDGEDHKTRTETITGRTGGNINMDGSEGTGNLANNGNGYGWIYNKVYYSATVANKEVTIWIDLSDKDKVAEANAGGMFLYYIGNEGQLTEDGDVITGMGYFDNGTITAKANTTTIDLTGASGSFTVNATANPNVLVYTKGASVSGVSNNVVSNGTCANLVLTDGHPFKATRAFTATNASYNMTAVVTKTDGKTFGTLMLPFAATTMPAGNKVYVLDQGVNFGEEIRATEGTIAANAPVLVTKSGTYSASNVAVAATADTHTNGQLVGTYKAMTALENTYVLQSHSGRVAFFMVKNVKPTVNPFRAYIKSQGAGARDFLNVVFDDETGLDMVNESTSQQVNQIYDLSGRRVNNAVKGIYIINGKKVIK